MKYEQLHSKIVILNLIVIGVISLEKTTLTLQEVLRHSNHDLLNHLHLIRMNLDLNRVDEAKQIINDLSENCKMYSMTNKLGLTKTALWIQLFKWRFPAIMLQLHCDIDSPVEQIWDETIEQYLEKTIIHLYEKIDPFEEQVMVFRITSKEDHFSMNVHLKGHWEAEEIKMDSKLHVQLHEWSDRSCRFEISLKE